VLELPQSIDGKRVRAYRLNRTRELLAQFNMDASILYAPLNLRYATGCRNMQIWTSHYLSRYVFSWKMHDIYTPNRYAEMIHGIGFGVDYPVIYYPEDHDTGQYSGAFMEGMCVCVESYVGPVGGDEGVKLEQPVLITSDGPMPLTTLPFEDDYL
jgi:Xaa-Pro aminopeptidase